MIFTLHVIVSNHYNCHTQVIFSQMIVIVTQLWFSFKPLWLSHTGISSHHMGFGHTPSSSWTCRFFHNLWILMVTVFGLCCFSGKSSLKIIVQWMTVTLREGWTLYNKIILMTISWQSYSIIRSQYHNKNCTIAWWKGGLRIGPNGNYSWEVKVLRNFGIMFPL